MPSSDQKMSAAMMALMNPANEKLARFVRFVGLSTVGPNIERSMHPTTSQIESRVRPYLKAHEAVGARLVSGLISADPEAHPTTIYERALSLLLASYFISETVNRA